MHQQINKSRHQKGHQRSYTRYERVCNEQVCYELVCTERGLL